MQINRDLRMISNARLMHRKQPPAIVIKGNYTGIYTGGNLLADPTGLHVNPCMRFYCYYTNCYEDNHESFHFDGLPYLFEPHYTDEMLNQTVKGKREPDRPETHLGNRSVPALTALHG